MYRVEQTLEAIYASLPAVNCASRTLARRRRLMSNDSFFALACMAVIALFYGSVLCFAGYRFFMFLLPIFGFIFGFGLGAQTMQAIFGEGFLSTAVSWVVGFVIALVFAVLSYLFYFLAVALLAGSVGYALGVGFMELIGFDFGLLTWLVGIALGIVFAVATLMLNIQKWVIIIATALMGAGVIVGTFLFLIGKVPTTDLVANPVKTVLNNSPIWFLIFLVIAILGFVAQYQTSRSWQVEEYSRWDEVYATPSGATATMADTTTMAPPTMSSSPPAAPPPAAPEPPASPTA